MQPGPRPDAPRGAWRLIRGALLVPLTWSLLGLWMTGWTLFALLTLRIGVTRYTHVVARPFGRMVLWLAGIRLIVNGGERIAGRRTRILTLNHTSQLDLFVMCAILPEGGTALAKQEILWVPFVGVLFWAFKVPRVDRGDLERAKRSLARTAERLRANQETVGIAPEGTRSRDGRLAPFKLGMFHLAVQTHAPIVPAVLRGAGACQPMGQIIPHPGTIVVDLLPEILTDDWSEDQVHARRDALRRVYAEALGEG